MNTTLSQIIKAAVILPLFMGIFAFPTTSQAGWNDILGGFGYGGSGNQSGYDNYYDANSVVGQHNGEIRLSKRVRRVQRDQNYHETTVVRSGDLVEVWLEIKNTSNQNAAVTVTDQLGGSVVYKKNSLLLNGSATQPGLTSGGLRMNVPARATYIITYQIYVCGGSSYAIRANAYSPGIGSATDAVIIEAENDQFTNSYSYNDVYTCMNQFNSVATTNYATPTYTTPTYANPTYNTTYAVSAGNPFSDWTGVNNLATTDPANPFAGWTGVNNLATTTPNNPFAGWSGVNNANAISGTTNNPFGDWYGVNNANTISGTANNAFGEWHGVNSTSASNPFGDWAGVNNNSGYDMRGYTNNQTSSVAYNNNTNAGTAPITPSNDTIARGGSYTTNFVAPTTGVNKFAPLSFAALLTLGFVVIRKRKFLFS